MASRGRHGSMNFVAMRRVRRCGLRVVFVASNNTSISFPLQCVRRCGLRTAVLHPTAHHHRCLAMHDFFFYRLTCSYRFMFFLLAGNFRPRLVRVLLVCNFHIVVSKPKTAREDGLKTWSKAWKAKGGVMRRFSAGTTASCKPLGGDLVVTLAWWLSCTWSM